MDRERAASPIGPKLDDWVFCFLVDQSGSMKDDPILHVAAALKTVVDRLIARGAEVSVAGYSTVGWHGGRARQQWLFSGQPRRPGRLCALLHVVYNEFGEGLETAGWEALMHPDLLRENVDGEALLWAEQRLSEHRAARKALIVLSDGAPVDDATLLHNGSGYLERHLRSVIDRIEREADIALGAVGVGFDVSRYYGTSEPAKTLGEVLPAIEILVDRLVVRDRAARRA